MRGTLQLAASAIVPTQRLLVSAASLLAAFTLVDIAQIDDHSEAALSPASQFVRVDGPGVSSRIRWGLLPCYLYGFAQSSLCFLLSSLFFQYQDCAGPSPKED